MGIPNSVKDNDSSTEATLSDMKWVNGELVVGGSSSSDSSDGSDPADVDENFRKQAGAASGSTGSEITAAGGDYAAASSTIKSNDTTPEFESAKRLFESDATDRNDYKANSDNSVQSEQAEATPEDSNGKSATEVATEVNDAANKAEEKLPIRLIGLGVAGVGALAAILS